MITNNQVNLALHRAAYQSDSIDDDHTAHLVTDGSQATYWESRPGSQSWLAIDLGAVSPLNRITLHWGAVHARAYRIEVSEDQVHPRQWKEIHATTKGRGGIEEIPLNAISARHVRLTSSACSTDHRGCVLSKFEIYGTPKAPLAPSPEFTTLPDNSILLCGGNWKLQNAMFVSATPAEIAHATYDDSNWIPARVPGTVLGSYVALGAVPDPWYGDQMSQISEEFFSRNDFWYRCHFRIPAEHAGKRLWLNFDGINWKAEVFLNGQAVGRIDGAFIRGRLDITAVATPGEGNYLAVLIHRVAHPGPGPNKIAHKKLGSPTFNGDVLGLDSPTFVAGAGWNWLPIVRGRNIGIWNEVRVEASGEVTLVDPWVISELPLPDTSRADLIVKTELRNHSLAPQRGTLIGQLGDLTFEQPVALEPGQTKTLTLDKSSFPVLSLSNPRLWWPNGYGEQPLYVLKLRFESNRHVTDIKSVTFGIRKVSYQVLNGVLTLFVNGKRILCRGGNWGMDEGMLNCDREGYEVRVRLHHDANLNMIRNWVGMVGREAFYDACDRYGILIWDDFWLANPADGPEPLNQAMFMANAKDKIRRVRSHPSLVLYCGRNEGYPPSELDAALRAAVDELDHTRHYLSHSAAETVSGFGPYDVRDPEWYFANRGQTFHSELGICAVPSVESMHAMMPEEYLWPINDMWAVHDYQSPRMPLYTQRLEQRYGPASGIEDYCRKAQMVNLESAKAMFECLRAGQGSGMLLWMTQPAWPSLICQLYDYFFEPTAAYFGARTACAPLHILWECHSDQITVANNTLSDQAGLTAEAAIYDLSAKELWRHAVQVDVPASSASQCFMLQRPRSSPPLWFIKLTLRRGNRVLSDNFYWASARGVSCEALDQLPRLSLSTSVSRSNGGATQDLTVQVTNPTQSVALMIRLKLLRASGQRVLPAFYEDNYFSLLPGECRTVSVEFATANLNPTPGPREGAGTACPRMEPLNSLPAKLAVEGWNIVPQEIPIQESQECS